MDDVYQYPVFLQCGRRLSAQQCRAVERHFSLRRRSSGGDCGPLARAGATGYSLAFRRQTDQQRVLQRCEHVVELADGPLMLTVHGSLESHNSASIAASTPSQESTAPVQSPQATPASIPPPGGEEYELRPDSYLLRYLKECPKVWQDLEAELASMACSAQLYPEEERVLVRRLAQPGAAGEGRNWKAEVDKVFDGYLCHFEVDPHKTKALRQSCSSHQATDGVKVYGEMGIAVVVGKPSQVKARLMEVEELTVKHRRSHSNEKQSSICRLGEAKLRLLWKEIEQGVGRGFPGVEVTRRDVGQVALEGSVKDVLEAVDWISDKENLVSERAVGDLRPHLLGFLRKAYGGPGELRDFLEVDDDVEIELQGTELRLFSLSAYKLDDAEEALQREFREMKVDVPDCAALSSELHKQLKSKTYAMNQVQFRAQVLFDSGSTVCLLGHTKEVEELSETIAQLILQSTEDFGLAQELSEFLQLHGFDLSEVTEARSLLSPFVDCLAQALSLKDENTAVASYSLCDGLQVAVCQDDVTNRKAAAPADAANDDLGNLGGVVAAGSREESPESQRESSTSNGRTGDKEVTTVGNFLCEKLLHDSGSVAGETGGRVRFLLEKTVQFTLNMAEMLEIKYLALPCTVSAGCGVPVCSEAIVTAVKEFGSQGGRGLRRIALVDNRAEVVRAMQDACDRLLQDPSDLGLLTDAAAQETASGATVGPPGHGVHVETVQATIETQQVDAVVSPMFGHNPLSTRVGNTLSEIVGWQLTAMFTKESEEGTAPGDAVLVEGFTGLPSNAVIFLHLLPWDDDEDGTAVQVMRLGVNTILTACDNRGFGSVALPVLGAGVALGFPNSVAARVLQEEVHAFKQNRASRTPFLVRIVIHPRDTEASEVFRGFMKDVQQPDEDLATMRVVLLGKSGSGKSTLANSIFGSEEVFATSLSPNSVTSQCQAETRLVNGRSITLIDTPGFFDSHRPEEHVKSEMARCIAECAPGPHAFLIVLQMDRFTSQEQAVIGKIRQYFSDDALRHAVVVFTHGDQLAEGGQIEDFVGQSEALSDLVRKCGGRCHVFDNKYWKNKREDDYRSNRFQAEVLLETIGKMVMDNKGGYYTNEKLQAVRVEIKREEERLSHAQGNMSRAEIRQRALLNVSNRLMIQLAGTATGAVLGAFFGLALMSGFEITAVNSLSQLSKLKGLPAAGKEVAAATGVGEVAVIGTGVVAAAGGLLGSCVGYAAAQGARTPQEAAVKAATAVYDTSKAFSRK